VLEFVEQRDSVGREAMGLLLTPFQNTEAAAAKDREMSILKGLKDANSGKLVLCGKWVFSAGN
jgi:hypothetical protein